MGVRSSPAASFHHRNGHAEMRVLAVASEDIRQGRPISGSPDHLVGLEEEGWGDRQAERLGGLEVDHQLKPDREEAIPIRSRKFRVKKLEFSEIHTHGSHGGDILVSLHTQAPRDVGTPR
jgi:hypothetical protein